MSEIALKRMKLSELRSKRSEIIIRIRGKLKDVSGMLSLASVESLEKIGIPAAADAMEVAADLYTDYTDIEHQISVLSSELS